MEYQFHPLCSLFPRMSGYEFECLKLDIKENGLRSPITLHQNMILDGGNRYKACIELGINPMFEKFIGEAIGAFVLTSNLHRRHLTPSQSAAIVASVQDWGKVHSHGGDRKSSATNSTCSDTAKSRSNQSGASIATQRKADAVAKASPELAAKVGRGEVSLNAATREVAPQLAPKVVTPEEPPEPEYTELDAAHDQIAALQDIVAVGYMDASTDEKNAAKELISALRKENKTLTATLAAVTISRDTLMNENASIKRQCLMQAKKLKKYEGDGNVK